MGLGLALVKQLVELHGGTLGVHSQGLNQGSQFTVRLPRLADRPPERDAPPYPDAAAETSRSAAAPAITARTILIVDDNVDAAQSLAAVLQLFGHEARCVYDGHSALENARADPPEVVICDIGLPEMDGYDVARRMREISQLSSLHLIALTGYGQPQDRQRALASGFDHHLVKPVEPEQIRALIAAGPEGK